MGACTFVETVARTSTVNTAALYNHTDAELSNKYRNVEIPFKAYAPSRSQFMVIFIIFILLKERPPVISRKLSFILTNKFSVPREKAKC